MEIERPKPMSQKEKDMGNKLYVFLKQQTAPVSKQVLCELLGMEYNPSSDRRLRLIIAELAKIKPIISTSDKRGYKLAQSPNDFDEVAHQWAELDSRIKELEARKKPLIEFYEKIKYGG